MPTQLQGSESKAAKKGAARSRSSSRARPTKQGATPEVKSDRSTSRGRARARKAEANESARPTSRSPLAAKARRQEETPTASEVRSAKAEATASAKAHRGASRGWFAVLRSSVKLPGGGPWGSAFAMLLMPSIVFLLNAVCVFSPSSSKASCGLPHTHLRDTLLHAVADCSALAFLVAWMLVQAVLYLLPVGKVVDGYDSRERLRYRINLPHALLLTIALLAAVHCVLRFDVFSFVLNHVFGLIWWGTVLSVLGGFLFFLAGRHQRTNPEGKSGWKLHEFFNGRALNPRIRSVKWLALFDFKLFFALRVGMFLLALVNISYLVVHYREVRALDTTTVWYGVPLNFSWNLGLLVFLQVFYVGTVVFERNFLSTFDVLHEGFGWLMVYVDLVFLPFFYSASARFLLASQADLSGLSRSPVYLAASVLLYLVGFFLYLATNYEKHQFRSNPNATKFANARTIAVSGGRKILVSGWWGLSRHPNYIGDMLMGLSWGLLCGVPASLAGLLLTFYYPAFIVAFLFSRAARDDALRREKYGETAWKRYCEAVKWRVVPYVY